MIINGGSVVSTGGLGSGKLHGGSYGVEVFNRLDVTGGTLRASSGTIGGQSLSGSLAGIYAGQGKITLRSGMMVTTPLNTTIGRYTKRDSVDSKTFTTVLDDQNEPAAEVIIQCQSASGTSESESKSSGRWTEWSGWSNTPVDPSDTREVETKQVKVSDGRTEYRYGGYVTYDGKHDCWCETYLRNKFGSATLRYSNWSTTRYSPNGKGWSCGFCGGNHIGVDRVGSDGRCWWAEYVLPDDSYYWEESRTTEAIYETQYRYRDWTHS